MCDKLLKMNSNDITAMFFKGGAVGFEGRLRANRGHWLKAANDGHGRTSSRPESIPAPAEQLRHSSRHRNLQLLRGNRSRPLSHCETDDAFFPGGDRKKGLEQLRLASEHAKYARIEASYFLLQDYFMFEKDYSKAMYLARNFMKDFPAIRFFTGITGAVL